MAGLTGNACLPPSAQDRHTTTQKNPKKCDQIAADIGHGATDASVAVGHAATDASVPAASKPRYPSRRTTNVGGASSHPLAKDADADPIVPSNLASIAAKKSL